MSKCQNPFPSCQTPFNAVLACTSTATFTCVGGSAKPQGCDAQAAALAVCVLGTAFDGGFTLD
jgi:hypothetical protein